MLLDLQILSARLVGGEWGQAGWQVSIPSEGWRMVGMEVRRLKALLEQWLAVTSTRCENWKNGLGGRRLQGPTPGKGSTEMGART